MDRGKQAASEAVKRLGGGGGERACCAEDTGSREN